MDDFHLPQYYAFSVLGIPTFWVSPLGISKTQGIWVRGHPKLGDTQITVTPESFNPARGVRSGYLGRIQISSARALARSV